MFRFPDDIVEGLKLKHPDINIDEFLDELMTIIIDKTFTDGNCSIRNLGKFVGYRAFSGKLNTDVCRFKFYTSLAFVKKIQKDEYLLQNLPVKKNVEFGKKHIEKCKNSQGIRQNNIESQLVSRQSGKQNVQKKLAKYEILKALNE